jgi:putative ABC transport system ATP-binding protein
MTTPLIELNRVRRTYDDGPPAVDEVSLAITAGEAVAILGPSGSGKSTLLNLIAGLDHPNAGTVTVDGVRVDRLAETAAARYRRDRVGMIFQFFHLLDDVSVTENVMLPALLAGTGKQQARERAVRLLDRLGLSRHAGRLPGQLSGGQRQRVAVARALMNRPALLLADEPTGALDSDAGRDVRELLNELHADGQTLILVTHDEVLAQACATRTVTLVDGRIAADSRTEPVR